MEAAWKIAAAAVATAILAVSMKGMGKGEIALLLTLGAGIMLVLVVVPPLKQAIETFKAWGEAAGVGSALMQSLLRVCCVAFLTEMAAQICKDAGEGALAHKVAFAGKVILLGAALPIFSQVMGLFTQVMG